MESSGLTEQEARENLRKYGKNVLAEKSRFFLFQELLRSFFSPLILLLLGASLVSAFSKDTTDFFIIFTIVIASGGISFVQHFRAENAAKKLKSKTVLTATVIRDNELKEIPFSHVTIGDVVLLSAGDLVPADMQLFETKELSIDESSLTGESYPAEKNHSKDSAYAGTHVITGEGKGIVVAIGLKTQIGQLSEKIVEQKPPTEFDNQLQSFSIYIVRLILLLSAFVFLVNAFFHHNILSSFLFAVALAVGLTPELMPVIMTISLARGALRMEEKEVIVKFLPGIQNLGNMDILCMDKTGTITENAITLSSYENCAGKKDESVLFFAQLNSHFQSGFKNPLDKALLSSVSFFETKGYTKIDEIPFDFERKKLSIVVEDTKKHFLLISKGSPQKILEASKASKEKITAFTKRTEQLANSGYRVVALATKQVDKKAHYSPADEKDLILQGFLIFLDPVKKTVAQTLKNLEHLGITSKILTGDNATITKKICRDAGISIENILTGEQMQTFSEIELLAKIDQTTIFASLTPEQKAHIIDLFKKKGHVVGYLGDGINDAPPLKASDIGISVNNGSDIAKDVADVILMRKSLKVLTDGVLEGRKTFANSFKYMMMDISSNFGNMISVAVASLFLPFLPLLPVQILLINFLYDMSQITVPSDRVDDAAVQKPEQWSIRFLKQFIFVFGPISSLFDLLTFGILLFILHASIPVFRTGWFVESFITQTLIIFAIRTRVVPFFKSRPSTLLIVSSIVTLVAGIILSFTYIARYFMFVALPQIFWILLGIEVVAYFVCVEMAKVFFYKRHSA